MRGTVLSVCVHHPGRFCWEKGVVFAGVYRKLLVERALDAVLEGRHRDAIPQLLRQLHDFVEGRVDAGRADVQLEGHRFHTEIGVSVFYSPCEVVS